MDEESRHASLRLWDVLERVGVSERMRQLHRDTSICMEIMDAVTRPMLGRSLSRYMFGSTSEGTTTPGMGSDVDVVNCNEDNPVIDDIQQAPQRGKCLLMITDTHTRPGYVKLQVVHDGTPLTIHNSNILDYSKAMYDCSGRLCRKHITIPGRYGYVYARNGPADTTSTFGYAPTDKVFAYRSRTLTLAARESLLECFRSGWLKKDDVYKMISFGCLFVGVGHPSSEEKDIEWRVSFSLQERHIMFSLNATQHKCYVLLKVIKNILTSKQDVGKSITSYHCKTCLFRVIINTSSDQWIPVNLIECTLLCLTELKQCLHNGNLPNFFIKTNNMFERRVYGAVKKRLIYYLNEILNEELRVFFYIQSDYISKALRGQVDLGRQMYDMYTGVYIALLGCRGAIYKNISNRSNKDVTLFLFRQLCYLASTDTITEHTREETKEAITYLEQVLHTIYAQHLASQAFSTEVHRSRHHILQSSALHLRQGMIWDRMSGRLVYATILYRQGNMEMCCDLLELIEQNLTGDVDSRCRCILLQTYGNVDVINRIQRGNTDPRSIIQSYLAVCTIFLPSHSEIIPPALQYELYRSVGTPPGSCDNMHDYWYCWSVVDSKVYLYFLQYLVYSNQNKHRAKQIAVDNLCDVLQEDPNLGHRDTAYNLLGWIYNQEGQIQVASFCFLQSWMIRPQHNAAKWHMLNLIYQQFEASR